MSELILIVDDEESLCELMAEILAGDYRVIKAFNGKEALEMARANKPDLILSDIMMPQMTGVELLQAIRADPELKDTPVVLLSAASSPQVAREAAAFVKKPFELEILEKTVADLAKNQKRDTGSRPQQSLNHNNYHLDPARPLPPSHSLPGMETSSNFSLRPHSFYNRPDSC